MEIVAEKPADVAAPAGEVLLCIREWWDELIEIALEGFPWHPSQRLVDMICDK